jgi:hypothetical protein
LFIEVIKAPGHAECSRRKISGSKSCSSPGEGSSSTGKTVIFQLGSPDNDKLEKPYKTQGSNSPVVSGRQPCPMNETKIVVRKFAPDTLCASTLQELFNRARAAGLNALGGASIPT